MNNTVKLRLQRDPEFKKELLAEILTLALNGERELANLLLKDYYDS